MLLDGKPTNIMRTVSNKQKVQSANTCRVNLHTPKATARGPKQLKPNDVKQECRNSIELFIVALVALQCKAM